MATALNVNKRKLSLTANDRNLGTVFGIPITLPLSIQVVGTPFGYFWGRDMWGSAGWGATAVQQAAISLTADKRDTTLRVELRP